MREGKNLVIIIFALSVISTSARSQTQDTIPKTTLEITPRLNSGGYFPFTGAYINRNFNVDVNVFYERRTLGFFVFKSQDLEDSHSIVNYFQPGLFKRVQLTKNFKLRFFVGYLFSQTSSFRDKDSDYYTAAVVYWKLGERVNLENTWLFLDLSQSAKLANRLLVTYEVDGFRFDLLAWQRVAFESNTYSTSASVAINFPYIKLSDRVWIRSTVSFQSYLTEAKPAFAMRRGVLFQVAFPIAANF